MLVWHTRGSVAWERPIISVLRHAQLPIARPLLLVSPVALGAATLWLAWRAAKSNRTHVAIAGLLGCAAAIFVTEAVLKPLVDRHHLGAGSAVFPSGHVTAAAAWAMFAWLVIETPSWRRAAPALVPIVVAWAVISTANHYPADTIAGLLVGGTVVYCVVTQADRLATAITDVRVGAFLAVVVVATSMWAAASSRADAVLPAARVERLHVAPGHPAHHLLLGRTRVRPRSGRGRQRIPLRVRMTPDASRPAGLEAAGGSWKRRNRPPRGDHFDADGRRFCAPVLRHV